MTLWDWKCSVTGYSKEIVSCLISHVCSNTCESVMVREMKRRNKTWAEVDHAISRHKIESWVPIFLTAYQKYSCVGFFCGFFPVICRKLRINGTGNLIMTHVTAVHCKILGISKTYWVGYQDNFVSFLGFGFWLCFNRIMYCSYTIKTTFCSLYIDIKNKSIQCDIWILIWLCVSCLVILTCNRRLALIYLFIFLLQRLNLIAVMDLAHSSILQLISQWILLHFIYLDNLAF